MPDERSWCHASLPNAGLGNKLFVWAKARIFSQMTGLPLAVTGWTQLQLGSFIRGGDLRLYLNYFKRVDEVGRRSRARAQKSFVVVREPSLCSAGVDRTRTIYEFSDVPPWSDYFGDLRDFRDGVRDSLLSILTEARKEELSRCKSPVVCVQVRMGDFRQLRTGENFASVGGTRTPMEYFKRIIDGVREIHGSILPVEVVSDGSAADLAELLSMPGVVMAPKRSKIADILVMARSQVLVPSAGSTFGYWAGFLGESAIVHHPDHFHNPIRPESMNRSRFEGCLVGSPADWPPLFRENIQEFRPVNSGLKVAKAT